MGLIPKAAVWILLDLILIVAGVLLGAATTPRVNPHKDWGVTGATHGVIGMMCGRSLTRHNRSSRRPCSFNSF